MDNTAPRDVALNNVSLLENADGAVIGQVRARDPDPGDTLSWTVSDGRFEVVGGTLRLREGVALDHETEPSLRVTLTATDSGGLSASRRFLLDVRDVAEAPRAPALFRFAETLPTGQPGAAIGMVQSSDPDGGAAPSLLVSDVRFEIRDGVLFLRDGVALAPTGEEIALTLTAVDATGLSASREVLLQVPDRLNVEDRDTDYAGSIGAIGEEGHSASRTRADPAELDGGDGGPGGAGDSMSVLLGARTWRGTARPDKVVLERELYSSLGGFGGPGGHGGNALLSVTREPLPGPSGQGTDWWATIVVSRGGHGGGAGEGGRGGDATLRIEDQRLLLVETVGIVARATGGEGGEAGTSGRGGDGGQDSQSSRWLTDAATGEDWLAQRITTLGTAGGNDGAAARGGMGGLAHAVVEGVLVSAGQVLASVEARAVGGQGGTGSSAHTPVYFGDAPRSSGSEGGRGADGGTGGAGGLALAEVIGLRVSATESLDLQVSVVATGGSGGTGGVGGVPGSAVIDIIDNYATATNPGFDGELRSTPGTPSGDDGGRGGDGGTGGNALARLADAVLRGGDGADQVVIDLRAVGGAGGLAGDGAPAVEGFERVSEQGIRRAVITYGDWPGGPDGLPGVKGAARVEVTGNSVALGGGDDRLVLKIGAGAFGIGPGALDATTFAFVGNTFTGGDGRDTLDLSGVLGAGATVDAAARSLAIGGWPSNALRGFEVFIGTGSNDLFRDAAGTHRYDPGGGADLLRFGRRHGHDEVVWGEGDVIELVGFGRELRDFAALRAAATDGAGGVVIATPGGGSLTLIGVTAAALTADMFGFA